MHNIIRVKSKLRLQNSTLNTISILRNVYYRDIKYITQTGFVINIPKSFDMPISNPYQYYKCECEIICMFVKQAEREGDVPKVTPSSSRRAEKKVRR